MKHKILVPIDFGSQSLVALDYARFYASRIDAEIILLNVLEGSGIIQKFLTSDLEEKMAKQAEMALKQLAAERLEGMEYKICIRVGKVYEMIEAAADVHKPLMIVMGKTEEMSLKKKILGSNTMHVIQETVYPVVSVIGQKPVSDLLDTIFVPMDLSKPVKEQISTAIEFAKLFGAKIYAFSVDVSDDVAYETKLLTGMHQVKKAVENAGIECETEIVEGEKSQIVKLINDRVEKLKPIFTVIMVRDERNINELFMGSIAREILQTVKYPVLTEKPWDEKVETHPLVKSIVDPLNIL